MSRKYTCIDLFSGAGGLSKGFLDADFNVLIGVDFDDAALRTFEKNHGTAKAMKLNLFDHDNINYLVEEFEKFNEELDVLVGGPPCQDFLRVKRRT
ncbi:MAG: DNA cytosine methyltransferase [Coprobacillus cateniformis]